MNTIVKLTSNEGGAFDAQNNRVSFDIPAGRYFDLSTAYLNLVMSCPIATTPGDTSGTGVYVPVIQFNDSAGAAESVVYDNSALIRSVKMDCESRGSVEDIHRCDILTHNLNNYSKSRFNQTSQFYERLCGEFAVSRTKGSIFNELHKEGNVLSRNVDRVPVRIKLTDVMNFCKTTQYNTGKYGKTRVELELNLDKLATPTQYLGANTGADWVQTNSAALPTGSTAGRYGTTAAQNSCFRMMNADGRNAGTANAYPDGPVSANYKTFYPCADLAAGSRGAATGGITPRVFNRLEDSPFYVGQKVLVTATAENGNTTSANNLLRQIVRIDYNRGDGAGASVPGNAGGGGVDVPGAIAITLDEPLVGAASNNANGNGFRDITFSGALATFSPLRCDFAELILEELAAPNVQAEPDTIAYSTYKTEEIDCAGSINFQHQFMGHPNAVTMYVTQPSNSSGSAANGDLSVARTIQSKQNEVDSHRIRVNNKDTSSRQIFLRGPRTGARGTRAITNDPLHTHKQQSALVNSDRLVKNLNEQTTNLTYAGGHSSESFGAEATCGNMLIGQVLPLTAQPKTIQVNIDCVANSGSGLRNLALFQEILMEI